MHRTSLTRAAVIPLANVGQTGDRKSGICCYRCGKKYAGYKNNFLQSYSAMHKGVTYLPYCVDCTNDIYRQYLEEYGDAKEAVFQFCRKLDIYWDDSIFDTAFKIAPEHALASTYLAKISAVKYAGKSFDDTIRERGMKISINAEPDGAGSGDEEALTGFGYDIRITPDIIEFWGPGYTESMYKSLEQRKKYWVTQLGGGELDVGTGALIRQICATEIDINAARTAGAPVDKLVNTLNTLLGSAKLKPTQRDDESAAYDKTPMGVWIDRFEQKRPIPEPDPEFQDVDGVIQYITIWFLGHLCKMLGIKNKYCRMYEETIASMRVEHPEVEEADDEDFFNAIFAGQNKGGEDEL